MLRWRAVVVGCLAALGLQVAVGAGLRALSWGSGPAAEYLAEFVALLLAGFVTGHLAGRWHMLHGAVAASAFILASATVAAAREAMLAAEVGLRGLPPIDFLQLAIADLVALTAASLGGWLSSAGQSDEPGWNGES